MYRRKYNDSKEMRFIFFMDILILGFPEPRKVGFTTCMMYIMDVVAYTSASPTPNSKTTETNLTKFAPNPYFRPINMNEIRFIIFLSTPIRPKLPPNKSFRFYKENGSKDFNLCQTQK